MKRDLESLLDDPPRAAALAPWTLALIGVVLVLLLTACATAPRNEPLLPEVRSALVSEGAEPQGARPEEFAKIVRTDIQRFTKLAKEVRTELAGKDE